MFRTDYLTSPHGTSPLIKRNPETNQCIVFDIDNTLINFITHCNHDQLFQKHPELRRSMLPISIQVHSESVEQGTVTIRPGLDKLLAYCRRRFKRIIIWSAGTPHYVHIMSRIFQTDKEHFISEDYLLDRTYCTGNGSGSGVKSLNKVYELHPDMKPENTFIIDDKPSSFSYDPDNGITIPAFATELSISNPMLNDNAFDKLIKWFDLPEVKSSPDVRRLNKTSIFV